MSVPRPPWWAVVSSLAAPVALIGAGLLAQGLRPDFDPVRGTISALAASDAPHRWIMTTGLAVLGVAHVVTACGLRGLRPLSRGVLALAGTATVVVAAFPLQPGGSTTHGVAAGISFGLLALWPATTATGRGSWATRPLVALGVTVLSALLLLRFGTTIGTGIAGRWERVLADQQAVWPLVVVLSLRAGARMRA